jgi:ATP synthase protein I
MPEDDADPRLRALQERLETVRRQHDGPTESDGPGDAAANGWRMAMELVLAPAVGGGIGWAIDRGLGSKPIGLVIGLVLGGIAGFVTVMRLAGRMTPPGDNRKDKK